MSDHKYRNFFLTENKDVTTFTERFQSLDPQEIKYGCLGAEEKAPTTGHVHCHAYISFKNARSLIRVQRMFRGTHIDIAKGSAQQGRDYASKHGPLITEIGRITSQGRREDIQRIKTELLNGRKTCDVIRGCESAQQISFATRYATYLPPRPRRHKPIVYWFFGETGTGKSRKVFEMLTSGGQHDYWRLPLTEHLWFDGYAGQDDAWIDDLRSNTLRFSFLLQLLDRYPLSVPVKGGFVDWRPTSIFITTLKCPASTFPNVPSEPIAQLYRRLDVVVNFNLLI